VGKVHILPEVLAHQIAAGEIVERPASVVKELVENSIDAGARLIRVYLEEGGRRRIRVLDDGCGMSAEDAMLAFEHHATSKIVSVEDLHAIRTLGFRGEALPSIASVSRVLLKTVESAVPGESPEPGTEIVYHGGRRLDVREIGWGKGTEITVEDLFFNVPARKKFLKNASTELGHVSRMMTSYALAFPEIEFRLDHESRKIIDVAPAGNTGERVFQLFGQKLFDVLVPFQYEFNDIRVNGFASLPHEQRNNSNYLYLFVNRRMVKDRLLTHAIRYAYQDAIPSQLYPVVVLFLETDPALIDVNVHPTKSEIRFRATNDVHTAIHRAIEQGLLHHRSDLGSLARTLVPTSGNADQSFSSAAYDPARVQSSLESFWSRLGSSSPPHEYGGLAPDRPGSFPTRFEPGSMHRASTDSIPSATRSIQHEEIPDTSRIPATPVILGQLVESFIVAVDREGVLVIDQHVAHERILFDRALRELEGGKEVPVQRLLLPETVELDPEQRALADELLDFLNQNGFEVEWFGESTLLVRGVPALAKTVAAEELIAELLDELSRLDRRPTREASSNRGLQRVREQIAVSLSCRAAIKINTPLQPEKMQWLVDELFRCGNPYTCPHGRPIVIRLTLIELLKAFKRI